MVAAQTLLPVIGVPVQSKALNGLDSLLSIVQMPGGVPVATMAIGTAGATNAGLLAVAMLAVAASGRCARSCRAFRQEQARTDAGRAAAMTVQAAAQATSSDGRADSAGRDRRRARQRAARADVRDRARGAWAIACTRFRPDRDTPTGQVADGEVTAPYDDLDALRAFARGVQVVTFEFENVPAASVDAVAELVPVRPSGFVLHTAQHRAREKTFLAKAGSAGHAVRADRFGSGSRRRRSHASDVPPC